MTPADETGGVPAIGTVVPVDLDDACARLAGLGSRFESLVREIPDPSRPTRGLEWTLGETAAHVVQTTREYGAALRGDNDRHETVDDVVALVTRRNREELEAEPARDPETLAPAFNVALESAIAAAKDAGPNGVATFSTDYAATSVATVCGLIVELAVHGNDIARSIRSRWEVEALTAALGVYAAAAALPLLLDEGARGRTLHVEIRPRHGIPFTISVEGGRAWAQASPTTVDAHVSVDPFTFLLLAYGRLQPWWPVARGRLLVWGRKPWRALSMDSFFRTP
jgi:uncharacterized protein (TIGR03083 family)